MPTSAPRPCREPGCRALVRDGSAYCDQHKRVARGSFADRERGTRQQRGYGAGWEAKRLRVFERDKWLCQACKRRGVITPVGDKPYSAWCDHIVPKAEGGSDDDENLETLCRACERVKTGRDKNRRRSQHRAAVHKK